MASTVKARHTPHNYPVENLPKNSLFYMLFQKLSLDYDIRVRRSRNLTSSSEIYPTFAQSLDTRDSFIFFQKICWVVDRGRGLSGYDILKMFCSIACKYISRWFLYRRALKRELSCHSRYTYTNILCVSSQFHSHRQEQQDRYGQLQMFYNFLLRIKIFPATYPQKIEL